MKRYIDGFSLDKGVLFLGRWHGTDLKSIFVVRDSMNAQHLAINRKNWSDVRSLCELSFYRRVKVEELPLYLVWPCISPKLIKIFQQKAKQVLNETPV